MTRIGIDFGTTNSYVAVEEQRSSNVVATPTGGRAIPSYVAVAQNGRRLVGEIARAGAISNAKNTVFGIKRMLGQRGDSVALQQFSKGVPFPVTTGARGEIVIPLPTWRATPEELCALLLREERRLAESYLDRAVSAAVLAVPTHFDTPQLQATARAARAAGLPEVTFVHEPAAAVYAYGHSEREGRTIAVYHLGGQTFDFSVVAPEGAAVRVIATAGDSALGGEEIDQRLIEWFVQRCRMEHGIELADNTLALQGLKGPAERAKQALSRAGKAEIRLQFPGKDGEVRDLCFTLGRKGFDRMITPLILRTLAICDRLLEQTAVAPSQIDEVLLVGGQTRSERVQQLVAEFFGRSPIVMAAPEEAVALGACLAPATAQATAGRQG